MSHYRITYKQIYYIFQDDSSSNENISKRKTTGNNKGSSAQETVEMKELGN